MIYYKKKFIKVQGREYIKNSMGKHEQNFETRVKRGEQHEEHILTCNAKFNDLISLSHSSKK